MSVEGRLCSECEGESCEVLFAGRLVWDIGKWCFLWPPLVLCNYCASSFYGFMEGKLVPLEGHFLHMTHSSVLGLWSFKFPILYPIPALLLKVIIPHYHCDVVVTMF